MPTTIERAELKTERQKELLRVLTECFVRYKKREQSYYLINGMSTSHIVVHAIQDYTTLRRFWPIELVKPYESGLGTSYRLQEDTMEKVQDAVRATLKQLFEKGYVEQMGNEHERRWLLAKDLRKEL